MSHKILSNKDWQLAIKGITDVLEVLDMDIKDPSIAETPERFLKYLLEFRQPLDVEALLGKGFALDKDGFHGMVVQSNIPFRMVCEHHLLPATGRAAVGYVPNHHVVGLSKLTRLVQAAGVERPSLQEVICDKVVDILNDHLEPKGVMAIVAAEHGCMACRGVNSPDIITATSSVRGIFRDVPAARQEFFDLIQGGKHV